MQASLFVQAFLSATPTARWKKMSYFLLTFFLLDSPVHSSGSSTSSSISPISNFGPSWAASAAAGTIVAVPFCSQSDNGDENSILLVFQSPSGRPRPQQKDSDLRKDLISKSQQELHASSLPRWVTPFLTQPSFSPTAAVAACAVSCMTGLVSDVDYLSRCLIQTAESHRFLYEYDLNLHEQRQPTLTGVGDGDDGLWGDAFSRTQLSHPLTVLELVYNLARRLRSATQSASSRPYGVQALMVGYLPTTRSLPSLHVFTLDPSGGYRHWGSGATAIGRGAAAVRKHLWDGLEQQRKRRIHASKKESTDDLSCVDDQVRETLILALTALLLADGHSVGADQNEDGANKDTQSSSTVAAVALDAAAVKRMMRNRFYEAVWIQGNQLDDGQQRKAFHSSQEQPVFLMVPLDSAAIDETVKAILRPATNPRTK